MNTKELLGKETLDVNAKRVGKVRDIDFDMGQGIINYIVVKAGLTKKYDISLDKIDKIGDKIILKVGEDELGKNHNNLYKNLAPCSYHLIVFPHNQFSRGPQYIDSGIRDGHNLTQRGKMK